LNPLKVGLLALAALASVVVMSLKITRDQPGFGRFVEYRSVLDDATGIVEKTPIRVAGINAGRIKSIQLQGNKALLTYDVLEKIRITTASRMQVKSVGFLGDRYLDIDLGDQTAEVLPPGSLVPVSAAGGFEELGRDASDVLKEVREIAQTIKDSLRDEDNRNMLKQIISNINDVTASLRRVTVDNEDKFKSIVEDLRSLSEQLAYETDRTQKDSLMGDLAKIGPILDKTDATVDDLQLIMNDVKEGKGTIGKLLRDDAVVDQVSQTLSSVNRLVNRINNLEADIGLATGANTRIGTDTRFDLDLYPAPERFFRLGIVTNEFGPQTERSSTTYTSENGGAEERVDVRRINRSAIKFNLQVGRRIQRYGLRAGLIESTGGVGFDYFFPDYGIRTSMEVFDYQKDAGPNLRLLTEIKLWNVLFGRVAAEDVVSKDRSQSFTFSLGLRFTDQDLAALIGLLAR
jgi:phospholipid/cholesterol/gamma-HCH transport system substrate-binding protein